jgi:hypothetical protein
MDPRFFSAAVKFPTPGRTIASAFLSWDFVDVILELKPTFSRAHFKLRRFPTP